MNAFVHEDLARSRQREAIRVAELNRLSRAHQAQVRVWRADRRVLNAQRKVLQARHRASLARREAHRASDAAVPVRS